MKVISGERSLFLELFLERWLRAKLVSFIIEVNFLKYSFNILVFFCIDSSIYFEVSDQFEQNSSGLNSIMNELNNVISLQKSCALLMIKDMRIAVVSVPAYTFKSLCHLQHDS